MSEEYYKYLNKLCVIRNSISLMCFTILAMFFSKWWIVLFSILFTSSIEEIYKKEAEDDK